MKKFKSLFSLLVILTSSYLLVSCHLTNVIHQSYLIKVDSIHVPEAVASKTPFEIELFGIVGTSGCHSLESVQNNMTTNNDIVIEVWGTFNSDSEACPAVMVYLDKKVEMTLSTPGTYHLLIKQPDNTYLEKQLIVN
jgi:hypothetical protein